MLMCLAIALCLDSARVRLVSKFVDTDLRLDVKKEQRFQSASDRGIFIMHESNFFWFGWILTFGVSCIVLSLASKRKPNPTENAVSQFPKGVIALSKLTDLEQQCLRLREQLQQQKIQLNQDFQNHTFEQLQTLLTNYPSARKMAAANPNLPAQNLSALFTPLENLLESWGVEAIGIPWSQIPYDPRLHQPDTDDLSAGEPVYIRFVGYQQGDRILCPAKVSRTLPPTHNAGSEPL
jgi:molecular chaperone GrpE (heat shock protein)